MLRHLLFAILCIGGIALGGWTLLQDGRAGPPADAGLPSDFRDNLELQPVVEQVNREFRTHWASQGIESGASADALTVARRLSLGLTGTVPSLEEIRLLERQSQPIDWWVNRLLNDRRYADYFAERLARIYVGTENGPFIVFRRRRFVTWLSDQLSDNRPYNQLVHDLLAGEGIWTDSPQVNFITVTNVENQGPDPIRLAGRVTRAFLGIRIDCLQCHDDRLGTVELGTSEQPRFGTQQDFHQLAAYFGDTNMSLVGVRDQADQYIYQYLDSEKEEVVEPEFPFLQSLAVAPGAKREQLAQWVTHPDNKPFARATVNRVWALMFGKPLVEPIDNIPLHGPLPPGLETLSNDFVAHHYDLRRLIRVIAALDCYRMDSRAEFPIEEEHEQAFAVFPITRLRPEQVAGGLIQACSLRTIDADSHVLSQLIRFFQQNDFLKRYGDIGEDEFVSRGGTVTQRLLMMNGKLLKERTKENPIANASTAIANLSPSDELAVEAAYLSVLTRRPTARELAYFANRLEGTQGSQRNQALEDLYWVLLNSTEFSWNH